MPQGCSACCGALSAPGAVEIPSAQLAHGGRYTCVARNAAGSAHRHVTLHVQGKLEADEQDCSDSQHCYFNLLGLYNFSALLYFLSLERYAFPFFFHSTEPPVIQAQPGALDVIVNNPIVLPCETTGTPQPVITWQKEGINIITTGILPKPGTLPAPVTQTPIFFSETGISPLRSFKTKYQARSVILGFYLF